MLQQETKIIISAVITLQRLPVAVKGTCMHTRLKHLLTEDKFPEGCYHIIEATQGWLLSAALTALLSALCIALLTAAWNNIKKRGVNSPQTDQTFNRHPFTSWTESSCLDTDSSRYFGYYIAFLILTGPGTVNDVNSVYRTESIVFWMGL